MTFEEVQWCGCAHERDDHMGGSTDGHCLGEMVFSNEGQPELTIPCACEGFSFWYADMQLKETDDDQ
jgi:hypothetical protein